MVNALSELFHVSAMPRDEGWQPTLKPKTWEDPAKEAIEAALDAQRPTELPSRRMSYFAFATIGDCVDYAESENIGPVRHYYRVKLIQPVRAPITLELVVENLTAHRDAIYRHYWNADDGWEMYEYFSERMVVVAEYLDALPDPGTALFRLMADRSRLAALGPTW